VKGGKPGVDVTVVELENLITRFLVNDLAAAAQGELTAESNLIAGGYLDSVGVMRLIHHLESKLSLKIPVRDVVPANFVTIGAMVRYLRARQQWPAGGDRS
jgi:acyl carrier protein